MSELYALILAGGSGTRFWPLSREERPKQLLPLLPGAAHKTMIASTIDRLAPAIPSERILIVASQAHREALLDATGLPSPQLLIEPAACNTAPAILYGVLAILARDPEAAVAVLPADHAISPPEQLQEALLCAAKAARRRDAIVCFGIAPTGPVTGYGYIERGDKEIEPDVYPIVAFTEKPDASVAAEYVACGRYFWNSGMFIFQAERMVRAFLHHYQALASPIEETRAALERGEEVDLAVGRLYQATASTSIDYAIMEKEEGLLVLRAPFAWNDVGSPTALPELFGTDEANNCVVSGEAMALDATGNVVHLSQASKTAALLGVDDLVIIDTDDVLLVVPKNRDQEIRRLVELYRNRHQSA